jgi:putative ABC transport system substrate-binding protein
MNGDRILRLVLLLAVLAMPAAAETPGAKVFRLGQLSPSAASAELTRDVTLPELAKLGFSEGRNLVVDSRVGRPSELPGLARAVLAAKPDAIIAIGPDAIRAAQGQTTTVPIVVFGGDPVSEGYAASLARPGGNLTGVVILSAELDAKRLDLLHQAVPSARRAAALMWQSQPNRAASEQRMRAVAAAAGLQLLAFDVAGSADYARAFAAMRAADVEMLVIAASANLYRDTDRLMQLARDARLPTMCEWAHMARAGCLLGYGPSRTELRRRLAYFVARIFGGAAPSELPIETPTLFEFGINLKTAGLLGLTIPSEVLTRADDVIE